MGGKKKLTKKERQRIEAEKAEALRVEQEKERQRQAEEERERKRLERLEAERRQKQEIQENKVRRIQLQESLEIFNLFQHNVDDIFTTIRKKREWKVYMRCNGLPDPADPTDIRRYIHMWLLNINREKVEERNWLLNTNESSILTQDQSVEDMTKSHLKDLQHNIGDQFAGRVVEVLGVLQEIENAIHDVEHVTKPIRFDLKQLKYTLRTTLYEFVDEYSFHILSNIDRDMNLESLTISRHTYESEVFKVQQWILREAPQPPLNPKELAKLETAHTEVTFPMLDMDVALPTRVKCLNTAIRVLWLAYNHFSDYCPSYKMPNAHLFLQEDICKTARKEWRKRKELLKTALEQDSLPVVPVATTQDDEGSDNENPKEKEEPVNVMDADTLYANYENKQAAMQKSLKSAEQLGLKQFDINMRKQRIVAGIFYVQHFELPQQDAKIHDKQYLRNLVQPIRLRPIAFHETFIPPPPVLPGVRRLPEEIEAEMREVEAGLDRLGSVSIKLSEDIVWFEPPIVCRWESHAETLLAEEAERAAKATELDLDLSGPDNDLLTPVDDDLIVLHDFDLLHPPAGLDLRSLIRQFVVPRMPDGFAVRLGGVPVEMASSNDLDIRDTLDETHSPRPLFPHVQIDWELKLLEPRSIIDPDDNRKIYMFSKLLSDLDELCDKQLPYVDTRMEEISDNLSGENEEDEEEVEEEAEPEPEYMGLSFLRNGEFPWSMGKVEAAQETPPPADDDDDDESEARESTGSNSAFGIEEELPPIGKWSTRDVHDVKFNEDKLAIQFKFGRMGAFALAVNWYSNFPFQSWEIKPDSKDVDAVVFNLTGAIISIEVAISSDGYILNSYQGGQTAIVQNLIGLTLTLEQLKDGLARAAINMFPDEDAFCYTEGTCEKNAVMEKHLYRCLSALGYTHNFAWSRWNMNVGRRACVLLMREILDGRKVPVYSTLHVTPQKAALLECTDLSPAFSPVPIEGMEFHADLRHLSVELSHPDSAIKQSNMDPILRQNIIELLLSTRPLCFC